MFLRTFDMNIHKIPTKSPQTHSKERQRIVKEACESMSGRGANTVARFLWDKHKSWFATKNAAALSVKWYRGKLGSRSRKANKQLHTKEAKPGDFAQMPRSRKEVQVVNILQPGNWLIISDLQIPFHEPSAVEAALAMGESAEVDGILINGDFGDFHTISRFMKDPRERDLAGELDMQRHMLGHLRHRFGPKIPIKWKKGNHEERWEHNIWLRAPELFGVPQVDFAEVTGANEFNIEIIEGRTIVRGGKCDIVHGHEIENGAASPVNPARGLFIRTLDNYVMSHRHRTSEHTEKTAKGRFITCWSIGCLCGLWPQWSIINKWNHGAAILEVRSDKSFTMHNRRIHEGKVL